VGFDAAIAVLACSVAPASAGTSSEDFEADAVPAGWTGAQPQQSDLPTCGGRTATIVVAAGQRVVNGTAGRDVIVGAAAAETDRRPWRQRHRLLRSRR
jgi:hypothetical protein